MNGNRFASAAPSRRIRDAHRQAGELLLQLGITPHTAGFTMLHDGVQLLAKSDRNRHLKMTEELYPSIGEVYFQSRSVVEHAMRDAIHLAWQREDEERIMLCGDTDTPGNAALLFVLAEHVRVRT